MKRKIIACLLFCLFLFIQPAPVSAALRTSVENDKVVFDFPNTATFSATLSADADIVSVTLEYGNKQLTCGEVIAKAFPDFSPARSVSVAWEWDMRQSGSLPPGATLWWRWHYTDQTGKDYISETRTATWLDDIHNWQSISSGDMLLHYYSGSSAFAGDLLNVALAGLEFNKTQSGLIPESPINVYIYANTSDMTDAILFEPSWTGGMAFPEQDIVIIGISESDIEWGRNAMVHELTHVLVGHLTFTCLGDVPTWLNEGLAVFSEGELDPASRVQLDQAIRDNTLLSIRSISSGFSEVSDKAYLSYSESYSIVKFLIETHGQEKMTSLLVALRDGNTIEAALLAVYGFDIDGLEDAWREAIGATPRALSALPTVQPTPTYVPTIVPVSGAPLAVTPTPYMVPTSSSSQLTEQPTEGNALNISLTLVLVGCCCLSLLVVGAVAIGYTVRSQNRKGGNNG